MQPQPFSFSLGLMLLGLIGFSACKTTSKPAQVKITAYKSESEINGIKNMMDQYCVLSEGTFIKKVKTKDGNINDAILYNVVPVFTEVWGEHWLYAESAMPNLLEEPVEQLVMKIEKHSVDTFYVYNYHINNRERFALGWYDQDKLKTLSKEDLIMYNSNCYSVVTKKAKGAYNCDDVGYCKIEDGANDKIYYRTNAVLNYEGLCISSTLYDANKNVSRPAPADCYLFERDLTHKYHNIISEQRKKKASQ